MLKTSYKIIVYCMFCNIFPTKTPPRYALNPRTCERQYLAHLMDRLRRLSVEPGRRGQLQTLASACRAPAHREGFLKSRATVACEYQGDGPSGRVPHRQKAAAADFAVQNATPTPRERNSTNELPLHARSAYQSTKSSWTAISSGKAAVAMKSLRLISSISG